MQCVVWILIFVSHVHDLNNDFNLGLSANKKLLFAVLGLVQQEVLMT